MSRAWLETQKRARLAAGAAAVQRPVELTASTASDHLPERYDRDAVQVALDGIVSRLNDRITEARSGRV